MKIAIGIIINLRLIYMGFIVLKMRKCIYIKSKLVIIMPIAIFISLFLRKVLVQVQHIHACEWQHVANRRESHGLCLSVFPQQCAGAKWVAVFGSFVSWWTSDQRVTRSSAILLIFKILNQFQHGQLVERVWLSFISYDCKMSWLNCWESHTCSVSVAVVDGWWWSPSVWWSV